MSEARPGCFKKKQPGVEGKARIDRRRNSGGLTAARDSDIDLNALLKTRDVWVLCMTLFFYILYPTLVRFPMAMLSCVKLHASDEEVESYGTKEWTKASFLRLDYEEVCWQGEHLANFWGIAMPGFLVYGVGLPLMSFVLLYRNREHLEDKKYTFRLGLLYLGYRRERWWWEGISTLRKLGIILLSAFAHNDSLQLHFTMALLIFSFILHSTYHPFDISSSSGKRQGAKKESRLSCYECCCGHDGGTTEGIILHRMERNSIIISIMVLWSAVVFILNQTCQTGWCEFLSTLCVFFLLLSNLVFLVVGGRNFFRLLLQRIEKGKQRRLRESSVAAAEAALALDFIINPALGCGDPAFDRGEEKTKSLTRGETVYTQNAAWQGVELTVLPPSSEMRPQPPSPRPRPDGAAFHAPPKSPSSRQAKVPPPPKRSATPHQPKRPQNIRGEGTQNNQNGEDEYGDRHRRRGCLQYCKCFGYGSCAGCFWLAQDYG
jgi:hypothetical protein